MRKGGIDMHCRVCKELAAIKAATKADRVALKKQPNKEGDKKDTQPPSETVQAGSDPAGVKIILG